MYIATAYRSIMPNSLNFSPDSDASLLNKKNDKPSVSGDFFVMEYWKNISLENIVEEHDEIVYVEEWKDIVGYEGLYKISSFGRIKSTDGGREKEKIKKQRFPKNGYLMASLWKNNKEKNTLVHRLVGLHFIPNPENKKTINHKKGHKRDNRFFMLEWATQGENAKHSYKELGRVSYLSNKRGADSMFAKAVNKLTKDGVFIERFDTVTKAGESVNSQSTSISGACTGKYKLVKGFKWEYA